MANATVYSSIGSLGMTPMGLNAKSSAEAINTLNNLTYTTMGLTASETSPMFPSISSISLTKMMGNIFNVTSAPLTPQHITYTPANKASGGGGGTIVYYKMCARSQDNTSWQTWIVSQTPDFSGTQYGGAIPINVSTTFILAQI